MGKQQGSGIIGSDGMTREQRDAMAEHERISAARDWYWSDPGRHRQGRLDLAGTRPNPLSERPSPELDKASLADAQAAAAQQTASASLKAAEEAAAICAYNATSPGCAELGAQQVKEADEGVVERHQPEKDLLGK